MPKIDSLEPLMLDELRDLLDAEKQVTKALPKMVKAASSEELKAAFEQHLDQTAGQIERLNQVFEQLGERARGKKCEAMQSIIEEGQQMMQEAEPGPTRDALLIASAQKVEHYEMASYGTLRTYANQLGHSKAATLLEQTLKEERATDERLTAIAESSSNPRAAQGDERGEEGPRRRSTPSVKGQASERVRRAGSRRPSANRGRGRK